MVTQSKSKSIWYFIYEVKKKEDGRNTWWERKSGDLDNAKCIRVKTVCPYKKLKKDGELFTYMVIHL